MRISKKVYRGIIAIVCMLIAGVFALTIYTNNKSKACLYNREVEINILHTNDIHADIENLSYISQYKLETKNALWFDAGDATQGQPIATYTKGKAIIEMFNAAELDASAVGNHEFDYGLEQFMQNAKDAEFPFLAANVRKENGKALLKKRLQN